MADERDKEKTDPDVFSAIALDPEFNRELAEFISGAMATAGPDYGKALQNICSVVSAVDPIVLMGAFAMRYATTEVGRNPEYDRLDGMFWHHIELVQAFAVRQTAHDDQALPETVAAARDAVAELDRAWTMLELKRIDGARDHERHRVRALVNLRIRAHAVRGWSYADRMTALLENLLHPLDPASESQIGMRLSALPRWWDAIREEISRRLIARRQIVQQAEGWPVDSRWLARVQEELGTLRVTDTVRLLAEVAGDEQVRRRFLAQSVETRIHEIFHFDLAELTALAPGDPPEATVRSVLDRWSLACGEDGGVPASDVVLSNPLLARPFVASRADSWHLFCPWIPHHNPFQMIEAVVAEAGLLDDYMRRRSDFLEERTAAVFARALSGASVERSVLSVNPQDEKEYENDVLVLLGSHAIVAEAKGGRLGPDVGRLRGRPLRDRVDELLVRPSQQAIRLADTLRASDGPLEFTRKVDGSRFTVDLDEVRHALTIGVTLDPIADHLPRLADLVEAGITNQAIDSLAYSISLSDLELVADVLVHPSDIVHWLGRRMEIERTQWLRGDEMDFLGLYLETGFNLGENEFRQDMSLDVTGMSAPIDDWQYGREAGLSVERPAVKRIDWWEACLSRVEQRRAPGWTEIGVAMCHVAPPEQRELLSGMETLRDDIFTGRRSPKEFLIFHNGPEQRRTLFVGIVAVSPRKADREEQFRIAAQMALSEAAGKSAVVMSWPPSKTELPYLGVGLVVAR